MTQAADTDTEAALDGELDRLAADLLRAVEAEPVPPAIIELAQRLQAALAARMAARAAADATPE